MGKHILMSRLRCFFPKIEGCGFARFGSHDCKSTASYARRVHIDCTYANSSSNSSVNCRASILQNVHTDITTKLIFGAYGTVFSMDQHTFDRLHCLTWEQQYEQNSYSDAKNENETE
jgi:hypothetical protein